MLLTVGEAVSSPWFLKATAYLFAAFCLLHTVHDFVLLTVTGFSSSQ